MSTTMADCTRCGRPAAAHAMLATRTMKARGESVCPRCHMTISRGHRIGQVDGEGWLHVECVLGHKPPMTGWPSAA